MGPVTERRGGAVRCVEALRRGPAGRRARHMRRWLAACCATAALMATAACGGSSARPGGDGTAWVSAAPQGPTITIGVAADQSGLSRWHDGAYEGFDVDVARYVAADLGYARKQIVFRQVHPARRAAMLDDGDVDMVVAAVALGGADDGRLTLAGPYLRTRPALLRRVDDDARPATGERGDDADVVCTVDGSDAQARYEAAASPADGAAVSYGSYAQCMTALMVGSADAIAGDDVILRGLPGERGSSYRVVVDESAETVGYGIAVAHGRDELASRIAEALRRMIEDGSWDGYVAAHLTPLGYDAVRVDADAVAVR